MAHTQQLVERKLKMGMISTISLKLLLLTQVILKKLAAIGILGDDLHWFKSYLTDRTQYTDVNGHDYKKWRPVHCQQIRGTQN
jgi:uncharacterized membrane protein